MGLKENFTLVAESVSKSDALQAFPTLNNQLHNKIRYLSPLGWEHINLTGDYVWQQKRPLAKGEFRPLNPIEKS
jgi:hypothetical protein